MFTINTFNSWAFINKMKKHHQFDGLIPQNNQYSYLLLSGTDAVKMEGNPSNFSPGSYPNLWGWWRADAGVTGTSTVTAWADQSGNGHSLISVAGKEPTLITNVLNSKPVIGLGGAVARMQTATIFPDTQQNLSIYLVAKQTKGAGALADNNGYFFSTGSNSITMHRQFNGTTDALVDVNIKLNSNLEKPVTDNTYYTFRVLYASTGQSMALNNGTPNTNSVFNGNYGSTLFNLFSNESGSNFGNKAFAEILIFTELHDAAKQASIEYYLQQKYNHYSWVGDVPPQFAPPITNFTFTVTRTGFVQTVSSVQYKIMPSGFAPSDANDFQSAILPTGTITFNSNETSKVITIPVEGDLINELDETFDVVLYSPSDNVILSAESATGTIRNDDIFNVLPIASISGPTTWNVALDNKYFTLIGSGSTDSDGTIVSYAWTVTAGFAAIDNPIASTIQVTPDISSKSSTPIPITVQLIVTDNNGGTNTISKTVMVTVPPIATLPNFWEWWKADSTTNVGGDVTKVNSLVGLLNGINFNVVGTKYGTYTPLALSGYPSVKTNAGGTQFVTSANFPSVSSNDVSIYIVCKQQAATDTNGVFISQFDGSNYNLRIARSVLDTTKAKVNIANPSYASQPSISVPDNTFMTLRAVKTHTSVSAAINNGVEVTGTPENGTYVAAALNLFGDSNGFGNKEIYEILIFTEGHSASMKYYVEWYLRDKYHHY
jgi:hypothetical protein